MRVRSGDEAGSDARNVVTQRPMRWHVTRNRSVDYKTSDGDGMRERARSGDCADDCYQLVHISGVHAS